MPPPRTTRGRAQATGGQPKAPQRSTSGGIKGAQENVRLAEVELARFRQQAQVRSMPSSCGFAFWVCLASSVAEQQGTSKLQILH